MGNLEWFPLYVHRFLNSRRLRRMGAHHIGIYTLLICEEWEGGPLPDNDTDLAFMARCEASDARAVLEKCFTLTDAGWINPELEEIRAEQEEKRAKYAEAGRRGGHAKAANRRSDAVAMLYPPSSSRVEEKRVEEKKEGKTESGNGSLGNVENWKWGDFAAWYRTTGKALLWQAKEPPDWANMEKPWTMARDLTIVKALRKKGEGFPTIKGVIERNKEPTCMLRYNQMNRWDYWYRAKAEWQKAEELKGLGVHVEIKA